MAEKPEVKNTEEDKELAELLDSALQDFTSCDEKKNKAESSPSSSKEKEEDGKLDSEWNNELIKQLTECYNSDMLKMFNPDGPKVSEKDIGELIKEIAAKGQVYMNQDGGEPLPGFEETISQAVQELTQGLDHNKLGGDMMAGGDNPNSFFSSFNQNMMQCLLSKEVLYPALKEILDQFPDWLKNNKGKVSEEDYQRYETQQKLISEVCTILEKEEESDTVDVKNKRYEEVLQLMVKLQDYGQPPVELVGEVNQIDTNNCVLM